MAKINNLSKDTPNSLEINQLLKTYIMSTLNCHNVGRITAFDKDTQLCTVELLQVKQYNARSFIPAPITDVPLIILGGGGGHITMPDPVGTICLLIFMDRNIDNFIETGELYTPETTRMHDFTDCIALSTFKTLVNPIKDYDENAVSILNSEVVNEVQKATSLRVYPDFIDMLTSGKVRIANGYQNLATLMQNFITACQDLTVDTQTGLVTTASRDMLTNLGMNFNELLAAQGYTPEPTPTEPPEPMPTATPEEIQEAIDQSYASGRGIGEPIMRLSNYLRDDEIRLEGGTASRTAAAALFAVYGTTYGEGDGSTTFGLPDFRGRVPWGASSFGYIDAGLPNHYHYVFRDEQLSGAQGSSTMNPNQYPARKWFPNSWWNTELAGTGNVANVGRSSGVQGFNSSDTVQPPAIKVRVVTRYK